MVILQTLYETASKVQLLRTAVVGITSMAIVSTILFMAGHTSLTSLVLVRARIPNLIDSVSHLLSGHFSTGCHMVDAKVGSFVLSPSLQIRLASHSISPSLSVLQSTALLRGQNDVIGVAELQMKLHSQGANFL